MTLTPGQPRREARLPDLNVWMQTTGVALLAIKRYSPACVWCLLMMAVACASCCTELLYETAAPDQGWLSG
jgi:hypothetical protein